MFKFDWPWVSVGVWDWVTLSSSWCLRLSYLEFELVFEIELPWVPVGVWVSVLLHPVRAVLTAPALLRSLLQPVNYKISENCSNQRGQTVQTVHGCCYYIQYNWQGNLLLICDKITCNNSHTAVLVAHIVERWLTLRGQANLAHKLFVNHANFIKYVTKFHTVCTRTQSLRLFVNKNACHIFCCKLRQVQIVAKFHKEMIGLATKQATFYFTTLDGISSYLFTTHLYLEFFRTNLVLDSRPKLYKTIQIRLHPWMVTFLLFGH